MEQFQSWKDQGVATGGFVWVYNSEEWDLNAWASGMNRIFGAVTVPEEEVAVRLYSEKNFKGYCVSLPPGKYCQGDLAVYGMKAKDISSMELVNEEEALYQVWLYKSPDCTGSKLRKRTSSKTLVSSYDNQICSVLIEPNPDAIAKISEDAQKSENIYNLAGQRLNKMQKGINIINGKKILK